MYLEFLISLRLSVFHYRSFKFLSVFCYQPSLHYLGIGHDSPIFQCLSFATAIPRQVFRCQPFIVSLPLSAFRYQSSIFIVPSSSSQSFVGYPCFSQLFIVRVSLSAFHCQSSIVGLSLSVFHIHCSEFVVSVFCQPSLGRVSLQTLIVRVSVSLLLSVFVFSLPSSCPPSSPPSLGRVSLQVLIVRVSISLSLSEFRLSVVHHPSSIIHRPSSIVRCPSSVVHRPLSIVCRLSSIVCRLSSIICRPSIECWSHCQASCLYLLWNMQLHRVLP